MFQYIIKYKCFSDFRGLILQGLEDLEGFSNRKPLSLGYSLPLLIFIFVQAAAYGQKIGFRDLDSDSLQPWLPALSTDYQLVYHFGESDTESDFILIFSSGTYYAQIKSGTWSKDGQWIWHYENIGNVRIKGNLFYSDKTNGEFVICRYEGKPFKALKVDKAWSGLTKPNEYEVGPLSYPITDYYPGAYTQASLRRLCSEELDTMPKQSLKVMRNEIYARYGYTFKPGGDMDAYFKIQEWYRCQFKNVDTFLTELEKENIRLIQQREDKR